MQAVIHHNPKCGTSRNTLAMLKAAGADVTVVDYLTHPWTRNSLRALIDATGLGVRAVLRQKDTPYAALGLASDRWSDDELIDIMIANPILINRPIVVTELGTALCRPSELVLTLLPEGALAAGFTKEDGEVISAKVLTA